MTTAILFGIILAMLLLRQSIVFILLVTAAYVHVFMADSKIDFLIQDIWFTVDREVLLAIPLFILAGNVMSRGSIARRLINFMAALTSPFPGGLGIAAILSCAAFAAINGSSIVTMLAIGSIMYPALLREGYGKPFALGAIASAGTLGIIIPPSIPLILYGIMTEQNITHLFQAGIGPGLLLTGLMAIYALWMNRNLARKVVTLRELWTSFHEGIFALLMPVILLGGIYSGYFSPTESAAVALVYALIVDFFVHREMTVRTFIQVVLDTIKLLSALLPLLAVAGSLNTILDYSGVPKQLVEYIGGLVENKWLLLIGINILLLIVGCLMDGGSAILILAPLLMPLAMSQGIDPVHFGIIMIVNLEIGYLTPPVGLNLIVGMAAFKESFATLCKAVLPFIAIMLLALAVIILVPELSLYFVGS